MGKFVKISRGGKILKNVACSREQCEASLDEPARCADPTGVKNACAFTLSWWNRTLLGVFWGFFMAKPGMSCFRKVVDVLWGARQCGRLVRVSGAAAAATCGRAFTLANMSKFFAAKNFDLGLGLG